MPANISQILISIVVLTILACLWHARNEHFAQLGRGWRYILAGFVCLSSGELSSLVLLSLAKQDRTFAAETELFAAAGNAAIVLGLLLIAIGVHQWVAAAKDLRVESVTIKKRNGFLRERVSRDGMLLSTIPAALYRTSGSLSSKTSEITFVNNKIEELLGYSKTDFDADPTLFASLMHDDDKRAYETERKELWRNEQVTVEQRFCHRNGEYRWLRRHLYRLNGDEDEFGEWHGCIFDITDLKSAKARLTNFLQAAPNPVVTANSKGEIVLVNSQAERLFGYSSTELLGQYADILIPKNQRHKYARKFSTYLKAQTSREIGIGLELLGRHKDGTEFPIEITVNPIESDNEKLLAFAINDITARKDIEAQLRQSQKMEAVGQLTGGIAHDFNNILTIVIGNLQLLEQLSKNDKETRQLTRDAMDASMRATELVKRLLAFSRRQLLTPKSTCINSLVTGIEPLLRRTITEHISLGIKLADDIWLARIDQNQLENALMNLVSNARDALHSGGRLTIETSNTVLDETYAAQQSEVTPGEYVMVAVSDNGKGISKDVLPHVFDPFFTTKDIGKGSGLGLSMVYGFVKQSRGHIKVYSEEGHGTIVKIYMPRSTATDEDSTKFTERTSALPVGNETILLVEDDKAVREIAARLLASLGYKILQADCANEALMLLAEQKDIDLLFTDLVMPGGMTGTDLAMRAVAENQNLKVLYTSGYTNTTIVDNGLHVRGDDVLNKPYRKEKLAQSVRDVLDKE